MNGILIPNPKDRLHFKHKSSEYRCTFLRCYVFQTHQSYFRKRSNGKKIELSFLDLTQDYRD